jgi:hypothetical protein
MKKYYYFCKVLGDYEDKITYTIKLYVYRYESSGREYRNH